ncbi:MAG: septum formation protein Maf [Candidatus Omnitrophica bacterium]|nr:septum formation protein Maf [Candidatus Omnitrophota bacterium]
MLERRLILASVSSARRSLLENIGLKVKVSFSGIRESRRLKNGPAQLVKDNAAKKAIAVARQVKNAVVIGADTVVVVRGKLFGKPKGFSGGVSMLTKLSRSPHYVYTGLAVLDKREDSYKIVQDYEKTKVWMKTLTRQEIARYLKASKAFNKAGSFDIQARGALFIERIEGCFYNVVGLPLAKLHELFKKLNIDILILLIMSSFLLMGCATEYNVVTQEQDIIFYDTEKEVNIGRNASNQVETQFKLVADPQLQLRINRLGEKIVEVCDRKNLTYRFSILDEDSINAFALPGGFIYVNQGLIDFVKSDDELAGVLAHEIAHVVAKHSIKRLQASMGLNLLRIATIVAGDAKALQSTDIAATFVQSAYSRDDELLADAIAARYMRNAGFNPTALLSFLERLKEKKHNEPLRRGGSYVRTHPYISERISIIKQELGEELDFEDYINRTHSAW